MFRDMAGAMHDVTASPSARRLPSECVNVVRDAAGEIAAPAANVAGAGWRWINSAVKMNFTKPGKSPKQLKIVVVSAASA